MTDYLDQLAEMRSLVKEMPDGINQTREEIAQDAAEAIWRHRFVSDPGAVWGGRLANRDSEIRSGSGEEMHDSARRLHDQLAVLPSLPQLLDLRRELDRFLGAGQLDLASAEVQQVCAHGSPSVSGGTRVAAVEGQGSEAGPSAAGGAA